MKNIKIIILFFLLTLSSSIFAYDGITYYGAEITQSDRYNSNGQRLSSVREILRQDRANYYVYGTSSRLDQPDGYFKSKSNRGIFDRAKITISPSLASSIISGGPVLISVFVLTPNLIDVQAGLPNPNAD